MTIGWSQRAGAGNTASEANGKINVIAGATVGLAVQLGDVRNDGGGDGAGISIITAQPTFSSGTSMTFDSHGVATTGNTLVGSATLGGGGVVVKSITSRRRHID